MKRFGRNQRRKARQEIQELKTKVEQLESLGARNQRIVEDTALVLGQHFLTLPPGELEVSHLQQLSRGLQLPKPLRDDLIYDPPASVAMLQAASFMDRVLPVLKVAHHLAPDCEHYRVYCDGECAGYAVTRDALERAPFDVLVPHIAEEIAEHLVRARRGMA